MNLRPWKRRERMAEALERQAEAKDQQASEELERLKAQRPHVEQVAKALRRETIEINGWTKRAKKAFG